MHMKNIKKIVITIILIVIVITALLIIAFAGDREVNYDNNKSIDVLITEKYSISEIENMLNDIECGNLDYSGFKSRYNIECLRKTYQGYYAVFMQNDGKRVFVFMDKNMNLYKTLIIENVKEKADYNFLEYGKTTESEILEYDSNSVLLPVSSVTSTAHIIQEGLLVITYDRIDANTGMLLSDPIVKSTLFFSNDELPLKDDEMINSNVPYILEIDK